MISLATHSASLVVDYDLHGFVGLRLIDATAKDAATVTRQIGPIQRPLQRDPDITIRFVDQLPIAGTIRLLGVGDVGFDREHFYLLRGKHKSTIRVQMPIDDIGGPCEIVCERGLPSVPLLVAIINLTALRKGVLPLHATAFNYGGHGVLVTGWSKGGKTETLLSFMAEGALYIGDEWVYLTPAGEMFGIPEPIRVWDWHLREMPQFWKRVSRGDRARLRALRLLAGSASWLSSAMCGRGRGGRALQSTSEILKRQQYVHLPPRSTFGEDSTVTAGKVDTVIWVGNHSSPEVTVSQINAHEIADRMIFSLLEEQTPLRSCYYKFRFAFPHRSNAMLEQSAERQHELLSRALTGRTAYAVEHPYPVSLPALFRAISPVLIQKLQTRGATREALTC